MLLIHGAADDVLPIAAYHHAHAELTRNGFEVTGHVSPQLAHGFDPERVALGGRFLERALAGS